MQVFDLTEDLRKQGDTIAERVRFTDKAWECKDLVAKANRFLDVADRYDKLREPVLTIESITVASACIREAWDIVKGMVDPHIHYQNILEELYHAHTDLDITGDEDDYDMFRSLLLGRINDEYIVDDLMDDLTSTLQV